MAANRAPLYFHDLGLTKLSFLDHTGLKQKLDCWLTIIPSTDHTVDKFGHRALCKDIVLQVAAIVDHVELAGGVVVVEAVLPMGRRKGAVPTHE